MRDVVTLTRKELHHLFISPIAYVFAFVFVFFLGVMFFKVFFGYRVASMTLFFQWMPLAFAIVIPGITMRMWAEERKQGTVEFLLTAPLATWHIVAAKFLAGLVLVAGCLAVTALTPWTVYHFGEPDSGPIICGYLGSLLMGSTCIAIGMFLSAFARDEIVSFLVTMVVLLALVLVGNDWFASEFEAGSTWGRVALAASLTPHFNSIARGVVDSSDLFYYASLTALFLYLNTRVLELRRWR